MTNKVFKLSPSDFSFLWECKRCFYLKVVENVRQVSMPLPKIFTKIASMEKSYFDGKTTQDISSELPLGRVVYGEKWVQSTPITFPGIEGSCYISGRFDNVVEFDDGGFGVIDFKTAETKQDHVELYSRQLHAYAYALQHPAPGKLGLSPITKLGLCCLEPDSMTAIEDGFGFKCKSVWLECPRDDEVFMGFLHEVMEVITSPKPPAGSFDCQWCQYRDYSRRSGL